MAHLQKCEISAVLDGEIWFALSQSVYRTRPQENSAALFCEIKYQLYSISKLTFLCEYSSMISLYLPVSHTVNVFHKERMSPLGTNMPPAKFPKALFVLFARFQYYDEHFSQHFVIGSTIDVYNTNL